MTQITNIEDAIQFICRRADKISAAHGYDGSTADACSLHTANELRQVAAELKRRALPSSLARQSRSKSTT